MDFVIRHKFENKLLNKNPKLMNKKLTQMQNTETK